MSEFNALCRRHRAAEEREDYRAGVAAAAIANAFSRRSSRGPIHPLDFFRPADRRRTPWRQQLATVRHLNTMFGGKDRRARR